MLQERAAVAEGQPGRALPGRMTAAGSDPTTGFNSGAVFPIGKRLSRRQLLMCFLPVRPGDRPHVVVAHGVQHVLDRSESLKMAYARASAGRTSLVSTHAKAIVCAVLRIGR